MALQETRPLFKLEHCSTGFYSCTPCTDEFVGLCNGFLLGTVVSPEQEQGDRSSVGIFCRVKYQWVRTI
jgi:hypothetical protein